MPLLDIASSQPCSCFRNSVSAFRSGTVFRNKQIVVGNDRRLGFTSSFYWKTFCITEKKGKSFRLGGGELWRGRLMIKAVGTLEMTSVPCKNEGVNGFRDVLMREVDSVKTSSSDSEPESSSEDSTEVDEREKLRRMRISKANKGNRPWNKGRKHSPETLKLIKERTRLAMQDPKVKMKLVNLGHAQSEETRVKIGVGVRLGWERRREKLKLQDTCLFEWQNLVASAARKGLLGEEEMQWDSYKILDKQLKQEWLESVEQRKSTRRPKGSKRAPKSAEQKKKISEAIAAKWADPNYRNRVCSGLAKFHGIPEGVERKPKRKPASDGEPRKRSPKQKDEIDDVAKRKAKIQNQLIRSKRDKGPSYKDPLASTKLEMLKSIRAQRSAAVSKKSEAITRAKILIAEAEKAAEALEIAAKTSPLAQASLVESRTLIAEATRLIESIGIEDETISFVNDTDSSENSTVPLETDGVAQNQDDKKVNGSHSISTTLVDSTDFSFSLNGNTIDTEEELHQMSSNGALNYSNANGSTINTEEKEKLHQMGSNGACNYSNPSKNTADSKPNGALNYSNPSNNIADSKPNPNGVSVYGLEIESKTTQESEKQVKGLEIESKNTQESEKQVKTQESEKQVKGLEIESKTTQESEKQVKGLEIESKNTQESEKQVKTSKKWVRGRLVEVAEEV